MRCTDCVERDSLLFIRIEKKIRTLLTSRACCLAKTCLFLLMSWYHNSQTCTILLIKTFCITVSILIWETIVELRLRSCSVLFHAAKLFDKYCGHIRRNKVFIEFDSELARFHWLHKIDWTWCCPCERLILPLYSALQRKWWSSSIVSIPSPYA